LLDKLLNDKKNNTYSLHVLVKVVAGGHLPCSHEFFNHFSGWWCSLSLKQQLKAQIGFWCDRMTAGFLNSSSSTCKITLANQIIRRHWAEFLNLPPENATQNWGRVRIFCNHKNGLITFTGSED